VHSTKVSFVVCAVIVVYLGEIAESVHRGNFLHLFRYLQYRGYPGSIVFPDFPDFAFVELLFGLGLWLG